MALLSVILRELRLEARRLANYWLRVLAPAVMVFCFAGLVVRSKPGAPMPGAWLFADFHSALLIAVWLVAPLLTADCLAQEKREGTLQLLLLTRLSSSGIVAAKTLVHALRGFAVLLAALPILCLPFLLGGVSPAETIISAQLTFSMLMLGLGGGVLSSALTRSSTRATLLALALSFVSSLLLSILYSWCFRAWIAPLIPPSATWPGDSARPLAAVWWQLQTNYGQYWGKVLASLPLSGDEAWLAMVRVFLLLAGSVGVLMLMCAGRLIQRDGVPWAFGVSLANRLNLCSGRGWLLPTKRKPHRWRVLRRNPILWLQQRSWSARATKWGWCGIILLAEALLLSVPWKQGRTDAHVLIGLALTLGLIFASASSYRLEKRNGLLELILVTPMPARRLVSGRVKALWQQFFPPTCSGPF